MLDYTTMPYTLFSYPMIDLTLIIFTLSNRTTLYFLRYLLFVRYNGHNLVKFYIFLNILALQFQLKMYIV